MTDYDTVYDASSRTTAFEVHERGVLACLAGPGTGKTFSLLARTSALRGRGVPATAICYLTFIRAISDAFVEDYIQKFGVAAEGDAPRISTLHSLACRLLRNQGFRLGYAGELYFANVAGDDGVGHTILSDLLFAATREGCRTVPQLRTLVEGIQTAWQSRVPPASLPSPHDAVLPLLTELLRTYRLCDFDLAVQLALILLDGAAEWPQWMEELKHYFVDEYQDFNRAEQELIRVLAIRADSVAIVGDDDQSLYSGRGGSPEGMRALVTAAQNDRVSLVKCYRCRQQIVERTNQFQATMSGATRSMVPVHAGGDIRSLRFKSSKAELAYLVEYLGARLAELPEHPKPKDRVVCLFPSRKVLAAYYNALSPHISCEGAPAPLHPARRTMSRLLHLVARPSQRFSQRLLMTEFAALKPRHLKRIVGRIIERDIAPADSVRSLIAEGAFTKAALVDATEYLTLTDAATAGDAETLARWAGARIEVDRGGLLVQIGAVAGADAGDTHEMVEVALDMLLPNTAPPPVNPHSLQFLTMHGSKGLTRRVVVLPGLEEAWLPGTAAGADKEERERLFFVALSRATDYVLLTCPHNRVKGDPLNYETAGRGQPSSFLSRAGLTPSYHSG